MKIVGLVASPRKSGNTAWVLNEILKGAHDAEKEVYYFQDLHIKPCQGCFCCKMDQEKGCVLVDDMRKVLSAIKEADVFILGSPVYMGQMSGQAKIFLDRLFPEFMPHFSPFYKEHIPKKLLLIFTQGNPDVSRFQTYYDYTKSMFQLLGFDTELHVASDMRSQPAHEQEGLSARMIAIGEAFSSRLGKRSLKNGPHQPIQ